jgi:hypothetical protein
MLCKNSLNLILFSIYLYDFKQYNSDSAKYLYGYCARKVSSIFGLNPVENP